MASQNVLMASQNVLMASQNALMASQNVLKANQNVLMASQNVLKANQNILMASRKIWQWEPSLVWTGFRPHWMCTGWNHALIQKRIKRECKFRCLQRTYSHPPSPNL